MKYADIVSADVPRAGPLNPRQVVNSAGGFVIAIDDWARLDHFLVLGSSAPTYGQNVRVLIRENAAVVDSNLRKLTPVTVPEACRVEGPRVGLVIDQCSVNKRR